VPDQPTADFMKQMYYYIAEGQTKAEALRLAKMQFLKSGTLLARPRYWAPFVLNGDGWNASRRVIPWSTLAGAVAVLLALVSLALWWGKRRFRRIATGAPAQP